MPKSNLQKALDDKLDGTSTTSDVPDSADKRYMTDAQRSLVATMFATVSGWITTQGTALFNLLFSPQQQSDWNEGTNTAADYIKNKPTLFSGAYADLSGKPTIPSVLRTTSALSLSLVSTGATGTQISSTKDATIRLNVSTSTTTTIGGPATSIVALKICSTNNATEASWTTVALLENDQTVTLAIVLQSIQVMKGQLCADIPAGWYAKLVNSGSGTHSEASISGQQTIYG